MPLLVLISSTLFMLASVDWLMDIMFWLISSATADYCSAALAISTFISLIAAIECSISLIAFPVLAASYKQ
jgi:hypothetical protein